MERNINSQLSEIVGEDDISTSLLERKLYSHDAAPIPSFLSFFFKMMPDAVIRPESANELFQILRIASAYNVPVIPRAGGSWSLGGVTPVKGGIVIDLVKMNKIEELSVEGSWAKVEAGIVWQDFIEQLAAKGLSVTSYPSSSPSATVGGWISTGGYGIGSLKYGHISEQVEAMEIVTPTGEIIYISKDSIDPKIEWFLGTEGQLGIISKVKLKIRTTPEKFWVRAIHVSGYKELIDLTSDILKLKETPYFLKIIDSDLANLRNIAGNKEAEGKDLVLVAFEGPEKEVDQAVADLNQIARQRGLCLSDEDIALTEWQERYYPMRIGRLGPTLLGGETIIPVDQLEPVLNRIKALSKKYNLKIGIEAEVISKEHVLILAMYLTDERKSLRHITHLAVIRDIINIGIAHGGKPYGTGLWNSVYIKHRFDKEYLKVLKGIKRNLDPKGIMNTGKFFQAETRFRIRINNIIYSIFMNILGFVRRFQ